MRMQWPWETERLPVLGKCMSKPSNPMENRFDVFIESLITLLGAISHTRVLFVKYNNKTANQSKRKDKNIIYYITDRADKILAISILAHTRPALPLGLWMIASTDPSWKQLCPPSLQVYQMISRCWCHSSRLNSSWDVFDIIAFWSTQMCFQIEGFQLHWDQWT